MCPREKMMRRKMIMKTDHFKYLVDQVEKMGADTISVFGYGEPMLDKEIFNKIQYCTDKGLKTFVTTNGSCFNLESIKNLLDSGLSHIRFSIHGTAMSYNDIHRGLDFRDVYRNFSNFYSTNKIAYGGRCRVSISAIPFNEGELETIKEAWKGFELEIWKPHNWADGRTYRSVTKKRKKTCGRPHRGPIQINADGKMMVCCFDYDAVMTVGDTHKCRVEEILKSDSFNLIRKKHEGGNLDGLPCETCDQLNIGDSPLLYSTVDSSCGVGKTSSTKFNLEGD